MSRSTLYLTVAAAFGLHNAEEAWQAPRLLEFVAIHGPAFLRGVFASVEVGSLRAGLLALTVLGIGLALLAARGRTAPAWAYTILLFASVMGLNAVAHIGLSLTNRAYMPGLVTAVTMTLPVAVLLLRHAWREHWVTPLAFWTLLPAAVVVHGPLLVGFIRRAIIQRSGEAG